MSTRVVITGLGIVSPIGIGIAEFWKAALEGREKQLVNSIKAALTEGSPESRRRLPPNQTIQ